MPSSSTVDPGASSFGWRLANLLAIASPYLIAASLFLFLYVNRAPAPRSFDIAEPAAPSSSVGSSAPVEASAPAATASPGAHPEAAPEERPAPRVQHAAPSARPAPPASKPALNHEGAPGKPVPVDAAVAGTMRISGAPPGYPAIAQAAGIQGTVVLAVTVASDGSVLDARAVSGPPLLQPATISAVRAWRYRPWLVYGKAVPFQTVVSIDFKISAARTQ